MANHIINTNKFSKVLRERVVNLQEERLLLSSFRNSAQEKDLTIPPNCNGFGRIRHFRRFENPNWPQDPLPIDPAIKSLMLDKSDLVRAQVFQLAACNWRCWYCFVDYSMLSADPRCSAWFTTDELVEMYMNEPNKPNVIDLTGGHPGLVPEWVPWIMRSLIKYGLDESTYLWSDDNLSIDYLWRYLDDHDIELIRSYKNYGRVGCFKGFDEISFAYNTGAHPQLFYYQQNLMKRLLALGIDQYGYTTFTTPDSHRIKDKMARFVDDLQKINPYFPLRTIPLEIKVYKSNNGRAGKVPIEIINNQYKAIDIWKEELAKRFTTDEQNMKICDVPLI